MKKLTLIFLVIAGSINIVLGLNGSSWNYFAAILFALAAISTYKSAK